MRPIVALTIFAVLSSTASAPADEVDDAALLERAARDRAPRARDLDEQERLARIDLTLAQVQLDLVVARKALQVRDYDAAADRALRAQIRLRELPAEVEASAYELQAEGIIARAAKAGVNIEALQRQVAGETGQRIDREPIPADPPRRLDARHVQRQAELRDAYQADAARLLVEADAARVVPKGEIAYPDDWPERVARRADHAGGEIARSASWLDADGREWYAAVYDVQDLIYVPPDFQPSFSLDPVEDLRNTLDRDALRWRSGIFNWGLGPYDWWQTIPLLRAFGGFDDYVFRGPKYSAERQQQIVEMIQAFNERGTEAKIISLEPVGP